MVGRAILTYRVGALLLQPQSGSWLLPHSTTEPTCGEMSSVTGDLLREFVIGLGRFTTTPVSNVGSMRPALPS